MAESTIVTNNAAAQAAATEARKNVKVFRLTKSAWFTVVGVAVLVLIALAVSTGIEWTTLSRVVMGGVLWIIAGQLAKYKVKSIAVWDNVPQVFKSAAITLWVVAFLLSGLASGTAWLFNETEDCVGAWSTGDYSDCFEAAPGTPGTEEVRASEYMGRATGDEYTLTDHTRLTFEWPYNHCVRFFPTGDVLTIPDAGNHRVHFLSRSGDIAREIKSLAPGETWRGYTC